MRLRLWLARAWAWCQRELDAELIVVVLGVTLITIGIWPLAGRLALIVPGAIAVWLALPARASFIERLPPRVRRKR